MSSAAELFRITAALPEQTAEEPLVVRVSDTAGGVDNEGATVASGDAGARALYPYQAQSRDFIANLKTSPCNVLCASPTGSGKSYLIECAARYAVETNCVAIVAEPLIALAEQMHRKLEGLFGAERVCLVTGPSRVGHASEATCLVCTYEVVARMVVDRSPVTHSCGVVVIDEFHFLSSERGPVLQEILHFCRECATPLVCLSGTLRNDAEVARYLGHVNTFPTFITGMSRRPVELTWYFWDVECRKESKFSRLVPRRDAFVNPAKLGGVFDRQRLLSLVRDLQRWDSLPSLIVAFSCQKLDEWAEWASTLRLLDRRQRRVVTVAFEEMLRAIDPVDHCLFDTLRRQALAGVFTHHSHHPVPYLRLVSELAERRCCPLVFCTSTLSAGINMPVRTVVLCGATIPRRRDTEMTREVIDSLLLQQLAGRAGRPGYETEGNMVVVGQGWDGYLSAQGLLTRPLPLVHPSDTFNEGDVLRAVNLGRSLALDRPSFFDGMAMRMRRRMELYGETRDKALATLPDVETRRRALRLGLAFRRIEEATDNVPLLRLCEAQASPPLFYHREPGSLPELREEPPGLPLARPSATQRPVPLQHFEEVSVLREHIRDVVASAEELRSPAGSELLATAALALFAGKAQDCLESSPLYAEESTLRELLRRQGLLEDEFVLTATGRAALHVRYCQSPSLAVRVLTTVPLAGAPERCAIVASALLGDGHTRLSHLEEVPEMPATSAVLSGRHLVECVRRWYEGASLAAILQDTEVSVGEACRHIARSHDMLTELVMAATALGLPEEVRETLELARGRLCRGLPFLSRNVGVTFTEDLDRFDETPQ